MDLQSLVISQSEAFNNPRYLEQREKLQSLSRLRQAKTNVKRATKQLELAKQVYRNELRHCHAKRYALPDELQQPPPEK